MPLGTHWHCRINKVTLKGNLAAFSGVTAIHLPARTQPNSDIISLARALVDEAESGRAQGVVISWLDQSGQTYSANAGASHFPVSWLIGSIITAVDLATKAARISEYVPFE